MAVLIYALTSYKNAMHTCTGNLNISPGFESFEILRIPNFPPTLKIYVGALNIKHIGEFDFNKRIPQGFYWCRNLGAETINPPSSESIACVILSFGSCELIIGTDIKFYCGRYTSAAGVSGNWNIFLR